LRPKDRIGGETNQLEGKIRNMREESSQWKEYKLLREEVLEKLPQVKRDETKRVKEAFLSFIPSRRRYERISSIPDLILELEQQLVIFPEKRGIKQLGSVIHYVEQVSNFSLEEDLHERVKRLTRRLEPARQPLRGEPVPSGPLSDRILHKLGRDLEKAGGRDWEHFATGLGLGLEEQEDVRVKQGEVDNIEREEGGNTIKIVKRVVELFGKRCADAGVTEELVEHIAKVLESHDVFEPPLRRLARELRDEKKKEQRSQTEYVSNA